MLRVWRAAIALLLAAIVALAAAPATAAAQHQLNVLVFTKTSQAKAAHPATSDAIELIEMTGRRYGLTIEATDDASKFTAKNLRQYDVVMWLNTEGDVLNDSQQTAFIDWVAGGGGYVGVHSAAATEKHWKQYGELVGARPDTNEDAPATEKTVSVNTDHQSSHGVPETIEDQSDQWYSFDRDPEAQDETKVLATVPGVSGKGAAPIAWCHPYKDGRSWYLGMGHTVNSFEDGDVMKLLRGGLWWAGGEKEQPLAQATDAAPGWPYVLSFFVWIAAVATGGAIAVAKLNRVET